MKNFDNIDKSGFHIYVCYHCGKGIHGKMHVAPRYRDIPSRAYHPACYVRAEKQAAKELGIPYLPTGA